MWEGGTGNKWEMIRTAEIPSGLERRDDEGASWLLHASIHTMDGACKLGKVDVVPLS